MGTHDAAAADTSPRPRVALINVVEGPELQPETAFTSRGLRRLGFAPSRVATDFCTEQSGFQATLRNLNPVAILLPDCLEFRELLLHFGRVARETTGVIPTLFGDGLRREGHSARLEEGVRWAPDDDDLARALGHDHWPSCHDLPMDLPLYPDLPEHPATASLFAERGTVALVASRPASRDVAPTALLARLEAPRPERCILVPAAASWPVRDGMPGLSHVEWWDRDFPDEAFPLLEGIAGRGWRQSVRVRLGTGRTPEVLERLRERGVHRVVFEVDRTVEGPALPGSTGSADDLRPYVAASRELSLEVAVLLVVGLPGETRASARATLDILREIKPDRLRCVPFEPTGGTPAHRQVAAAGLLPATDRRWERELHRPLNQACLHGEDFIASWAEAHLLLAEVETGRGRTR